jgi:hypothetical protein
MLSVYMKYPAATRAASLALLLLSAAAVEATQRRTLHTPVPEVAAQSKRIEFLPATNRLRLDIGLPLRNQSTLTNLLHQLYNPASTNFHRFLSPQQFTEQFAPTEQEYQSVMDYARSNRLEIVGTFSNRALVDVAGSVAAIEAMFQVRLGLYPHPSEDRRFFAPDVEPSIESGLPISYVSGLDNYVIPQPLGQGTPLVGNQIGLPAGGSDPTNTSLYLGNDFRNAYVPGTTLTGAGQVVGVFELGGYTPSDIQTYETYAGLPSVPINNVGSLPVGQSNHEVASDIELLIAMAPGLKAVNVYDAPTPEEALNEIASPSKGEVLPNQVSCSWLVFLGGTPRASLHPDGDAGAVLPHGLGGYRGFWQWRLCWPRAGLPICDGRWRDKTGHEWAWRVLEIRNGLERFTRDQL